MVARNPSPNCHGSMAMVASPWVHVHGHHTTCRLASGKVLAAVCNGQCAEGRMPCYRGGRLCKCCRLQGRTRCMHYMGKKGRCHGAHLLLLMSRHHNIALCQRAPGRGLKSLEGLGRASGNRRHFYACERMMDCSVHQANAVVMTAVRQPLDSRPATCQGIRVWHPSARRSRAANVRTDCCFVQYSFRACFRC